VLTPLYDRLALRRAGSITRQDAWWTAQLDRHVRERHPVLAAVHTGPDGDDGFALAVPRESDAGFADRILRVEDLHAASTAATAALWRFLLDVDLVGTVEGGLRPLDEPLELLLADPRDVTVTGVHDETWLRIVDVPVALAARSYGEAGPVLLAVHDPLLETNAGVYLIADGTAERVGPLGGPHAPQLECDAAALAMAYLGDRAPSQLAATGWWTAHDAAALERADRLFATGAVPWCGTFF
jgi:predicted acetyltransferase